MEEKEKQYIEKCMSIYKITKEKGKKIRKIIHLKFQIIY